MPALSSATPLDATTRAAWQSQGAAAKQTLGLVPRLMQQRQDLLLHFAALYQQLHDLE